MTYSIRRAAFVTFIAVIGGFIGWFLTVNDWHASLPLAIFYTLLVVNTYPSVRIFSSIIPMDNGQHALVDILIAFVYVSLVVSFGNPPQFVLCALVLFLVAAGKYSLMVEETPHANLVLRKVRVDLLGALLCAAVLGFMVLGFVLQASWALAVVFAVSNIYVLGLKPLYRL